MRHNVLAVILGGGRGTRLYPLTKVRSKPAVPIGGKYRLIDIPLSNCLHSDIETIYIVTQFNSASLHRHIHRTYRFDVFTRGFVEILAAEQTLEHGDWFQGTADAVRRMFRHFDSPAYDRILVLSGDHLYRMDYREFLATHLERDDDVTISVKPVGPREATEFGILHQDETGRVRRFVEKPQEPDVLESLRQPGAPAEKSYLASMGIYLFRREVLMELLKDETEEDFGRQVIPRAIEGYRVGAHRFDGYWRDIGTIRSFYEANLALTWELPEFNFYEPDRPIYTHPRFLPSTKINDCHVRRSILSEGAIITNAMIEDSIIGIRTIVRDGTAIRRSIVMGADYYEGEAEAHRQPGDPDLGVGYECVIMNAIIDKNARIGSGSQIMNARNVQDEETETYVISDGIVVIPKGTVIPPGTVI